VGDDMNFDAGGVFVEVRPEAPQFLPRLREKVLPAAERVGTEIGRQMGDRIAQGIASGVQRGLTQGNPSSQGRQFGREFGRAFGEQVRVSVSASLRDLPKANVSIDTTAASAKVAKLRSEIGRPVDMPVSTDGRGIGPGGARRAAEDWGGEFERVLRTRLLAAQRALPPLRIGVAASEAEQQIRDLSARITALSGKRVGVDITAGQALADIRRLNTELSILASTSPDVKVRVEAARASAELATVRTEVDRLDRTTANVRVNVDGASAVGSLTAVKSAASGSVGSISGMVSAGIMLGPAIVPAAAAAAGAITGITMAAAAGGGAIGVLAVGLVRTVAAIKAMSAAEDAAQQTTDTLAKRNLSLAGSSDQVRTAKASLANTVASAAESQRRAGVQVATAERSVAQAQREALAVQQTLTAAREDARRNLEDLGERLTELGLQQEQAALDQADAEAAAKKKPTDKQADLTYRVAQQRVRELASQQKRLSAERDDAQAKGIEGSTYVAEAKDKILQAEERVRQAEEQASEARLQQAATARQSAASIASAQQGVVTANRQVESSAITAGEAGSAAMLKLEQTMQAMSPAARQFSTWIYGLKPELLELVDVAETALLPGLQAALTTALPYADDLKVAIRNIGSTTATLAGDVVDTMQAPVWRDFFGFLSDTATPTLQLVTRATLNVASGVAGIATATRPAGEAFNTGILGMTASFANFGATLGSNQQFQQFLDYAMDRGPKVIYTIGQVAETGIRLARALAPIGDVTLQLVDTTTQLISIVPIGLLQTLGVVIVATTAGLKAMEVVGAASNAVLAIKNILLPVTTAQTVALGAASQTAAVQQSAMSNSIASTASGATGARAGLSSVVSLLSGPWGAAVVGATVALGGFASWMADSKQKTTEAKNALMAYAEAAKSGSGSAVESMVRQNDKLRTLIDQTQRLGIDQQVLNSALQGDAASRTRVVDAIDKQIIALRAIELEQGSKWGDFDPFGLSDASKKSEAAGNQANELARLKAALTQTSQEQAKSNELLAKNAANSRTAAAATDEFIDKIHKQSKALDENSKVASSVIDLFAAMARSNSTAAEKATALRNAIDSVTEGARKQEEAQLSYEDALDKSAETTEKTRLRTDGLTAEERNHVISLDRTTQASRDAERALIDRASAIQASYIQDIAAGVPENQAKARLEERIGTLQREYQQAGFNRDRIGELTASYGNIPKSIETTIDLLKFTDVMTNLDRFRENIIASRVASGELTPQQGRAEMDAYFKGKQNDAMYGGSSGTSVPRNRYASGGEVHGPGTTTSDSIPALLSDDEHIWSAREVVGAGGHANVSLMRKMALAGNLPMFSNGGPVYPIKMRINTDRLASGVLNVGSLLGNVIGGRPAGGVSVDAVQSWIRAQSGKPYIWASAGPVGYDCSGLVSAVYNLMHGKYPYAHTFSTATQASYFPKKGSGVLTVGWSNAGERGGGSVGHTAGNLAGLGFESRGGAGVVVGNRAVPLSNFAHIGTYDSGGWLPNGALGYNGTGLPEAVLDPQESAGLKAMVGATSSARGGDEMHIHLHGTDDAMYQRLRARERAEQARRRLGRRQ
jgi:hypothetical protein